MHHRRSFSRWRLLLAAPRSGAENMARDTTLLARAARTGETVFSIYSWAAPTLSFGRNQPAAGRYDERAIRAQGIDIVRRPTGGRAILHRREVTYSVTAPLRSTGSLRASYSRINRILIEGLARLGVFASVSAPTDRAPVPSSRPCFDTPGEGELVADGRKLVGSAQWRDETSLLQHGSILVEDDQSSLPSLALEERVEPDAFPAPATLGTLMGRVPPIAEVASAMFAAVQSLEDDAAATLDEMDVREEALHAVPQFLDEEWTWRR